MAVRIELKYAKNILWKINKFFEYYIAFKMYNFPFPFWFDKNYKETQA